MSVGPAQIKVVFRKPFGPPQRWPFCLPLVTQQQLDALVDRENVWQLDVKQDPQLPRTDAVGLTYSLGTEDTDLASCTVIIEPTEQAEIDRATGTLQAELAPLLAEASPSDADKARIAQLQARMTELQRTAFWQEVRNPFGDGAVGLYRSLAAANVSCRIRTNEKLEAERPFTVWLYRCKPQEDQEDATLRIAFGGRWRLELGQANGAKLYLLRTTNADGSNMTPAQRQVLEVELHSIEDSARLTPADKLQIRQWRDQVAQIQADAARQNRRGASLTSGEQQQIGALKASIRVLEASKRGGLTGAVRERRKELMRLLFEQIDDVQLYEPEHGSFNVPFSLTFVPQERGYLSILTSFSANYWTGQVKRLVAGRQWGTVCGQAPLEISNNGGALWWKWAYPEVDREGFIEGEANCGQSLAELLPGWQSDQWSAQGCWFKPPGTTLTYDVDITDPTTGAFRWRLSLGSDGRFIPLVYTQRLELLPLPRDVTGENVIFDTSLHPGCLAEATARFDYDFKGRGYSLTLNNEVAVLDGLLHQLEGAQVEVHEGSTQVFAGVAHGRDDTWLSRAMTETAMDCIDRWDVLREDVVWTELVGDGLDLGEHVKDVLRGRGFTEQELAYVRTDTGVMLPSADPGEEPIMRAKVGEMRGAYLRSLLDSYAVGWEFWFDAQGLPHLEPMGNDVPQVWFVSSTQEASRDGVFPVAEPELRVDFGNFYNWFQVIGGLRPGSKNRRYAAVYADYASVYQPFDANRPDGRNPGYLGYWKPRKPEHDESLNTQEGVNRRLRKLVEAEGRVIREWGFSTTHSPLFCVGLKCDYLGAPGRLTQVSPADRKTGRTSLTVRLNV